MRGTIVIGIIGAIAILGAAIGLAVDVARGMPTSHALVPTTYDLGTSGAFARSSPSEPPIGPCVLGCGAQTRLDVFVQGLPAGTYQGRLGDETFFLTLDTGVHAGGFDVPREVQGDVVDLQWRFGDDWRTILQLPVNDLGGDHEVVLLDGTGSVTLEQTGAVEVSALAAGTLEPVAPPGQFFVAWLDDERLGTYEDGVLDARVERLVIAEHRLVIVTLEGTPVPAAPGVVLFAAKL